MYIQKLYSCHNLFLKVQSDDELRKSPHKPFHVWWLYSEQRVEIVLLYIMVSFNVFIISVLWSIYKTF